MKFKIAEYRDQQAFSGGYECHSGYLFVYNMQTE